ncbi:Sir2 family NAD-dependent protein deacetylase [uncultured Rikenella sp.]|uniref:SIR2 family NAD-dependent protein deacylase n=1 Tax=uncultured Rikenella sp. TaxID=368003 RepID=UPI0025F9AECB|nr:Sir2 family NAD-dependent protein deacetylase [uncultured Rikenella sp.]
MKSPKKVVVFTGAGMSADSGVSTFRDADGLWENHRIEDVCTAEAWQRNPRLVLDFYNARRAQLDHVTPNPGHLALAALESAFDHVTVITQNVDDLHERAGSTRIIHLHGELRKARSERDPHLIVPAPGPTRLGDLAPDGAQLRPHIVFFGEAVPEYDRALNEVRDADLFLVIGTSLAVYPAAGLIYQLPPASPVWLVDPRPAPVTIPNPLTVIPERAAAGVPPLVDDLIRRHR